jgi:hypothetical protein
LEIGNALKIAARKTLETAVSGGVVGDGEACLGKAV